MESSSNLAPVILFVYNRIACTKNTIAALEENELAEESELYIFSDGPQYQQDIHKVEEVRDYIEQYVNRSLFKKVTIKKAGQNKGLAFSIIEGVTDIINKFGKVIVLEDDCVTTKDFLRYMNDALNYYEAENKVWSVSGYSYFLPTLKNYPRDIYFSYRGNSWGWGTWKDRWVTVDWDVSDYRTFRFNIKKRKKFARGGNDLASMLKAQMNGKIDSWAIRWCYAQSMQDKLTVHPRTSYVTNIGFDKKGIHCTSEMETKYQTVLNEDVYKCKFEDVTIDTQLLEEMYDLWKIGWYNRVAGFIRLKRRTIKKWLMSIRRAEKVDF